MTADPQPADTTEPSPWQAMADRLTREADQTARTLALLQTGADTERARLERQRELADYAQLRAENRLGLIAVWGHDFTPATHAILSSLISYLSTGAPAAGTGAPYLSRVLADMTISWAHGAGSLDTVRDLALLRACMGQPAPAADPDTTPTSGAGAVPSRRSPPAPGAYLDAIHTHVASVFAAQVQDAECHWKPWAPAGRVVIDTRATSPGPAEPDQDTAAPPETHSTNTFAGLLDQAPADMPPRGWLDQAHEPVDPAPQAHPADAHPEPFMLLGEPPSPHFWPAAAGQDPDDPDDPEIHDQHLAAHPDADAEPGQ